MSNEFKSTVPGTKSYLITPNDSTDLAQNARSLRVDGAGTLKFTTINDTTDTWEVFAGDYILLQVKRVFATGTTATGIHVII